MSGASVYSFRSKYVISRTVSRSRSSAGGVTLGPWRSIEHSASNLELGHAISLAIAEASMPWEAPADFLHLLDAALPVAGAKSTRTFERESEVVSLGEDAGFLMLTAFEHTKRGQLWAPPERSYSIGSPTDEELGAAVRGAFDQIAANYALRGRLP